ncbi:MAG: hypothetical protein JNK30_21855 [Phenylobacterium sp.]|uniref:hypothetical protein n=1 Tax=Phenylobacterium sp. TaxID=1871053 RepID=UPI001A46A5AE|nr:hypothetical protein [Phenylobacterium sp.]MBL8774047.1 hypothetical protein [Phenylobacterium sp.]
MRSAWVLAVGLLALGSAGPAAPEARKPVMAGDIPVAHTPPGPRGYGRTFPPPVLKTCTEPLVAGAPDLRGIWKVIEENGKPPEASSRFSTYAERIEQCGNRIVDMGGGTIADARADGTEANAVQDVSVRDFKTPIVAIASYENGVFILRPKGTNREVRRWLDDKGRLHWTRPDYGHLVLEKIGGPNDPYTRPPHPADP